MNRENFIKNILDIINNKKSVKLNLEGLLFSANFLDNILKKEGFTESNYGVNDYENYESLYYIAYSETHILRIHQSVETGEIEIEFEEVK